MQPSEFKALKTLAETLRDELSAIKEAINKETQANREAHKTSDTHWSEVPRIIAAAVRPAQHEIAETQARYDQTYRQQERAIRVQRRLAVATWCAFVAASAAAVGAFIYARIAAKQLFTMNQTYTEVAKQTAAAQCAARASVQSALNAEVFFRTDERAWIEIEAIQVSSIFPASPPFGKIFKYGLYPKNVGKTVARNVRIHVENPDASADLGSNIHAIRLSQEQKWKDSATGKRITIPDNPGPQVLAPGAKSPVPVFIAGQEPKHYPDGNWRYTYFIGRIDYIDAFDVSHWINFCFVVSNTEGHLANCQYGNDEDHNPEPIPKFPNYP
jgi:hypothetical protein